MSLKDKLLDFLTKYPEPEERGDDWNPYDASGGNFDDAYSMGYQDGAAEVADMVRDMVNRDMVNRDK